MYSNINYLLEQEILHAFSIYDLDAIINRYFKNIYSQKNYSQAEIMAHLNTWCVVLSRYLIAAGIHHELALSLSNKHYIMSKASNTQYKTNIIDLFNEAMLIYTNHQNNHFNHDGLNKMIDYIMINLENSLDVLSIAAKSGFSYPYANKLFKKYTNDSIKGYYLRQKINRSKYLLVSTDLSITEIALQLAFHDQSHFTNTFIKYEYISPFKYRANHLH